MVNRDTNCTKGVVGGPPTTTRGPRVLPQKRVRSAQPGSVEHTCSASRGSYSPNQISAWSLHSKLQTTDCTDKNTSSLIRVILKSVVKGLSTSVIETWQRRRSTRMSGKSRAWEREVRWMGEAWVRG